ncbi:MAG: hypothetical protein QGI78_09115 [Phycisphaerales bacterium]|jgi:hypothetical protein|nr:hypothetical protein [Phycisphaerales bacterium]
MVDLFLSIVFFVCSPQTPIQNANTIFQELTKTGTSFFETNEALPRTPKHHSIETLDCRVFERKIIKKTHDNPIVDAFVRWQLTTYPIALPTLSDRAFQELLKQLPPYPENPRANARLCDLVARAAARGKPLSRPELTSLKQRLQEIEDQHARNSVQAKPADLFRRWIFEELQSQPERLALAHLERLASLTSAGWDVSKAFLQAESAYIAIQSKGGLSKKAQESISGAMMQISGINKLTLIRVDSTFDGTITPHWKTTAIDEFDLKRLLGHLQKQELPTDGFLGRDKQPPVKSTQ